MTENDLPQLLTEAHARLDQVIHFLQADYRRLHHKYELEALARRVEWAAREAASRVATS